jgi:hypothetical protein
VAVQRVIYFSAGGIELSHPYGLDNKKFEKLFPGVTGKRYDSFHKLVGYPPGVPAFRDEHTLPVVRVIEFKKNPSLHKCSAKCQNATGKVCECSCRSKNHGAGGIL